LYHENKTDKLAKTKDVNENKRKDWWSCRGYQVAMRRATAWVLPRLLQLHTGKHQL
jgi:hypothetical protein